MSVWLSFTVTTLNYTDNICEHAISGDIRCSGTALCAQSLDLMAGIHWFSDLGSKVWGITDHVFSSK